MLRSCKILPFIATCTRTNNIIHTAELSTKCDKKESDRNMDGELAEAPQLEQGI